MYANRYSRKTTRKGGLAFISRYWLQCIIAFLALIFGLPPLIRYIKRLKARSEENNLQVAEDINNAQASHLTPQIEQIKTDFLVKKYPRLGKVKIAEIKAAALKMAVALGYTADTAGEHHLFGLDFLPIVNNSWTEDEKTAVSIAKKYTGTFPVLCDAYYSLYTLSRDLKKDLLKKLSKSDLDEIRAAHLKYGGYKYL